MGKKLARKTLVRHPDTGVTTFLDVGAEPEPRVARLLGEHLFEGYDPDAAPAAVDLVTDPGAGTAAQVLEAVGDDSAKAAAALAAEQGRGDDARSTLVGKLEKIAAGPGANSGPGGQSSGT